MKIFIHGLGQTTSSWDKTRSLLDNQDAILCPSIQEFLKEENPITYQELYSNFSNYCSSIQKPLDLCGLSLGAVLALNYACEHPQEVSSLVLIAGQYKSPKLLLQFQNIVFRFLPSSAFADIGFQKKEMIELTRSMEQIDFTPFLKRISCPTLLLCGEKDKVNQKASQKASGHIKNSQFCKIQSAGHEVNIDAPQKLAEKLNHFYLSF